jgi:hypothetical protein
MVYIDDIIHNTGAAVLQLQHLVGILTLTHGALVDST